MEIEKRENYEKELAAALLLTWRQPQIDAYSGREPNWDQMRADIADRAENVLRKTQRKASLGFFAYAVGSRRSPPGFDPYAGHAEKLAGELVRARRKTWNPDAPRAWADSYLSRDRALNIGVTEITDAISTGEDSARDVVLDALGIKTVAIWNIDPRSNVCKICRPLDGKEESIWLAEFPHGPPAHPSCACYKTYRIDR